MLILSTRGRLFRNLLSLRFEKCDMNFLNSGANATTSFKLLNQIFKEFQPTKSEQGEATVKVRGLNFELV